MADGHGQKELLVKGHTRADNTALLLNLVLNGVGISRINDLFALPLVREGRLVPLLQTQFVSPRVPIYAVMLQERQRLPKIRACIDYWAQWLAQVTQELGDGR
jgi:DNA-binding transcriptional LysR family regulator